ncbi:hypothetical protein KAR91_30615 [Candidatus Pacearchaeota archaeon]|nr:hypothetical protein [Candidatus Pacearchaeota archaeon]
MASSDINIASQALALVRADPITSFNDGSPEAGIVSLFYNDFVQDMLTRHPWSFATKKRLLNGTTPPINQYSNAHLIPAECLRLWALYPDSTVGVRPINEYDIQAPDGPRKIFSNHEVLYGEYTIYTAETNWPGYFTHFLIYAFAAVIAIPVTDQPDIAKAMHTLAWGPPSDGEKGGKFSVATGLDAQQKPGEIVYDSPFVAARFSSF